MELAARISPSCCNRVTKGPAEPSVPISSKFRKPSLPSFFLQTGVRAGAPLDIPRYRGSADPLHPIPPGQG